jgi:hypothetical protein
MLAGVGEREIMMEMIDRDDIGSGLVGAVEICDTRLLPIILCRGLQLWDVWDVHVHNIIVSASIVIVVVIWLRLGGERCMRVVWEYARMREIRRICTLGGLTAIGLMIVWECVRMRGIKRICALGGLTTIGLMIGLTARGKGGYIA